MSTLLRVFTIDETRFPHARGRAKYNGIDFQSLRYLGQHPQCRASDLARHLGVAPTTVQSAMDRLIRRGLVARTPHSTSRRATALSLTEDGEDLLADIIAQDLDNMTTMLSTLDPEERAALTRILPKIAAALQD